MLRTISIKKLCLGHVVNDLRTLFSYNPPNRHTSIWLCRVLLSWNSNSDVIVMRLRPNQCSELLCTSLMIEFAYRMYTLAMQYGQSNGRYLSLFVENAPVSSLLRPSFFNCSCHTFMVIVRKSVGHPSVATINWTSRRFCLQSAGEVFVITRKTKLPWGPNFICACIRPSV